MNDAVNKYNSYKKELAAQHPRWSHMNSVLYKMCEDNPTHDSIDLLAGKFCIIGRSYAAAIERRRLSSKRIEEEYLRIKEDDIYYVGLNRLFFSNNKWEELDKRISYLKSAIEIEGNEEYILQTHKWFMDVLGPLTGCNNISFVSKYLHFHCPQLFFLYDERAKTVSNRLIKNSEIVEINSLDSGLVNTVYGQFYRKMNSLQNLLNKAGNNVGPRELDDFLLWMYSEQKKKGKLEGDEVIECNKRPRVKN